MENEPFAQKSKRMFKKILKWVVGIALLIFIVINSFYYFAVYEEGVMAGKVLRITEKGVMFKTYEGKLNLDTFGALKGTSPIAESFDFSVESGEKDVIKELEQVALSGERVNLHFIKRYKAFPWRGDTNYFVTKVERLPNP